MKERVTLVNRTGQVLEGTWNGKPLVIPLGYSLWTKAEAKALKEQNKLLGSYDQYSNKWIYKVAILEHDPECGPLTNEELSRGTERGLTLLPTSRY